MIGRWPADEEERPARTPPDEQNLTGAAWSGRGQRGLLWAEASLLRLQRLSTRASPGSKGWAPGVKNRRRVPSVPSASPASFPPCWLSDAGTPGPCPPAPARRPVPTITTVTALAPGSERLPSSCGKPSRAQRQRKSKSSHPTMLPAIAQHLSDAKCMQVTRHLGQMQVLTMQVASAIFCLTSSRSQWFLPGHHEGTARPCCREAEQRSPRGGQGDTSKWHSEHSQLLNLWIFVECNYLLCLKGFYSLYYKNN
ncbi:uncharacterized protein LOC113908607 isoform X2 [Zalophus californianus]|uniref:Uncharacterized protein LOC113908607 isoform X2 n=1 Tax=Zalophus californianus TaxID=9704 RepID=A0A6P9FED4_ZALCA|nr:uncharacterized protein LOC113908607 isoform X2 [Zalophus californianus]